MDLRSLNLIVHSFTDLQPVARRRVVTPAERPSVVSVRALNGVAQAPHLEPRKLTTV